MLDVAPAAVSNLLNTYNGSSGTLDTRPDINELANPPLVTLCKLLGTPGGHTPAGIPAAVTDACSSLSSLVSGAVPLPSATDVLTALYADQPLPVAGLALPTVPAPGAGGRARRRPPSVRAAPAVGDDAPSGAAPGAPCSRRPVAPGRREVNRLARVVAATAVVGLATSGCGVLSGGLRGVDLPGGADLGDHPYSVTIEFADVVDLVPQSLVKVDDVPVGAVSAIAVDPATWNARVTVDVNGDVTLPANATAQVRTTSLLGEKFVELGRARAGRDRRARARRGHPARPLGAGRGGRGGARRRCRCCSTAAASRRSGRSPPS